MDQVVAQALTLFEKLASHCLNAAAMTLPLVSIVMLSWNRKNDVRVSLGHVFDADYPSLEVIVVDNHSSDGTVEMVKENFPAAIVVPLAENIGIAGWNKGFEIAKGEYILVLDDDSYPDRDALSIGITRMMQESQCGILAMQVFNTDLQFVQTSTLIQGNNTYIYRMRRDTPNRRFAESRNV